MSTREIFEEIMIGKRFGRLTVIECAGASKHRKLMWVCECDCGRITTVVGSNLRKGSTQSCGCFRVERNMMTASEYSFSKNKRLYGVWNNMRQRCYNKNYKQFSDYGGRGITICNEWLNDFEAFCKWAMSHGYKPNAEYGECTIDRIDNNGNYCPENCRWVSMAVQNKNRRI